MADKFDSLSVATSDGSNLDVLVSGTAGMPLVFHNGTPAGLVPLPSRFDPSRQGLRTVLYARPGYNSSTPQPGRIVADTAADTAAILDALGADTFLTLGWSGGGPYALACAALLPDRCRATAVVAGPAPYPAEVEDWTTGKPGLALQDPDALTGALEAQKTAMMALQADRVTDGLSSEADRACITAEMAEWLVQGFKAAFGAGIAGARDDWLAFVHDWGFDLAEAQHIAIWQGGQDQNVQPANARWLAEHIPGAELHMLREDGHISIGLRIPEIVDDLIARANR